MLRLNSIALLTSLMLFVGCSGEATKNYLQPATTEKKVTDGNASDVFDPKADILFVIDDSLSMEVHQRNLAANIDQFTRVFLRSSILDFNIGVVTTTTTGSNSTCCGKLVGSPNVVNKSTPNADVVLNRNLLVGIGGGGTEKPFEATAQALSPSMLATFNRNFIRTQAGLIIIFITDANDQSGIQPSLFLQDLLRLKGNDKKKVLSYGAIIPSNLSNCSRSGELEPVLIEEFLNIVPNGLGGGGPGGNIVSLCAPDYGQRFAEFALQIVDQVSRKIYLTRSPDFKSLRVSYGAIDLPSDPVKGWTYNARENAIILGPEIDWSVQPVGSKVEVHYSEARG